jgi:hypothetical protein
MILQNFKKTKHDQPYLQMPQEAFNHKSMSDKSIPLLKINSVNSLLIVILYGRTLLKWKGPPLLG